MKLRPRTIPVLPCVVLLFLASVSSGAGFDVNGTVVDSQSAGVEGATVWLVQDRRPQRTQADSNGRFRFRDVVVGPVEIVAWKEGFAYGGLDANAVGPSDVQIVLVEPDSMRVRLLERSRDPRTATDQPPSPVQGARLLQMTINDRFHVSVDDLTRHGFPNPRSSETGHLLIENLPKGGHVSLVIGHREFVDERVIYYPVGGRELTLQLRRGTPLRGRVTNEAGAGIANARVSVFRSGPPPWKELTETVTDPDGFYEVLAPPGGFMVTAKHQDYATPHPVRASVAAADVEVICDLRMPVARRVGGRVLSRGEDNPVPGVTVYYVIDGSVYDQAITDVSGAFTLSTAAGRGLVYVQPPDGYIADRSTGVEIEVVDRDFDLPNPIRLVELPEIAGVVHREGGRPAEKVVVSTVNLASPQWAVTDAEGAFRLRLNRAPAEGEARFRAEDAFRFLRKDFSVSLPGESESLNVSLDTFEPNIAPCDPSRVVNPLGPFRDKPAPEIQCSTWFNLPMTGESSSGLTLQGLRGKVVVLTFWGGFGATERSVTGMALLNTLHDIYRDSGDVAVVGIHDSLSEPKEVQEYIQQYDIRFPVGIDLDTATFDLYDIFSIPQTVLIDKKGVLRFFEIEGRILELIKVLRREAP